MSDRTQEMKEVVQGYEERANRIERQIEILKDEEFHESLTLRERVEIEDAIYAKETELSAKRQFIEHYNNEIKRQGEVYDEQKKRMNAEFGGIVKKLRSMDIKHPKAAELTKIILKRFKDSKWDSHEQKWGDFANGHAIVNEFSDEAPAKMEVSKG